MKRLTIYFLAFLLLPAWCHSQDLWVLSSASAEAQSQQYHLTCTIGEPVIWFGASAQYLLTLGFQQPDFGEPVSVETFHPANWQLEVFPNPAHDYLNIRYHLLQEENLAIEVHALNGKVAVPRLKLPPDGAFQLEVAALPAGTYFIRFFDEKMRRAVFQFQVIR